MRKYRVLKTESQYQSKLRAGDEVYLLFLYDRNEGGGFDPGTPPRFVAERISDGVVDLVNVHNIKGLGGEE